MAKQKEPSPLPTIIRAWRSRHGLSAAAAGALVHTTPRVWLQWEAGDRNMHAAFWELAQLKIGLIEANELDRFKIVHGVEEPIVAVEESKRRAQRIAWHAKHGSAR